MNFRYLTEYLDSLPGKLCAPGVDCKIMYKNEEVYRHSSGWFDMENNIPVKRDAQYYIYSTTKPLTCTTALTLYEKGKFLLSDPLYEYMPQFRDMYVKYYNEDGSFSIKKAENPIRIVDLFTMSAGFCYNIEYDSIKEIRRKTDGKCPTLQTVEALAAEPLEFEPGTHFTYSLCHDILGGLIEVISGKKLGEYMKETVFEPLGMNSTGFTAEDEQRLATLYHYNDAEQKPVRTEKKCIYKLGSEYESGGAGLISTVDDYMKFLECLCHGGNTPDGENIISKSTIELMRTNHLDDIRLKDFWQGNQLHRIGYGYGLGVRTMIDPVMGGINGSFKEFGWPGAGGAYNIIDPERELSVFFTQHMTGMNVLWKVHPRLRNIIYSCLDK